MSDEAHAPSVVEGKGKQQALPEAPPATSASPAPNGAASSEAPTELSFAEKKKLAKAEKAARRAKEKGNEGKAPPAIPGPSKTPAVVNGEGSSKQHARQPSQKSAPPPQQQPAQHARRPSSGVASRPAELPVRSKTKAEPKADKPDRVSFFSHLYGPPRHVQSEGLSKDVHPAIALLGRQLSEYTVCGSHARGVALLLALKAVIKTYSTPRGTSLPRHLASHFLSPQLSHIRQIRPFSTTQANSIRWLKNIIANIDPSVPEDRAIADICTAIDTFVDERFTVANQVIADAAVQHVANEDVILTYAHSAAVRATLLTAAANGIGFEVLVVDNGPLFEGKALASSLAAAGVPTTYTTIHGLHHVVKRANKCFVGAHAILGNGALYSRAGTASVASLAKAHHARVLVLAETIKFSDRVALDSIIVNELAPEDELLGPGKDPAGWRSVPGVQLLNIMYDVTPPEYLDLIITELGSLPPSSAPAVQRISSGT